MIKYRQIFKIVKIIYINKENIKQLIKNNKKIHKNLKQIHKNNNVPIMIKKL